VSKIKKKSKVIRLTFFLLFFFFLFIFFSCPAQAQDDSSSETPEKKESPFRTKLGGYATTVWVFSGSKKNHPSVTLNTNRLRLSLQTFYKEKLSLSLDYDLEAYTGNLVSSPYWNYIKNDQAGNYWNLLSGVKAGNAVYLRQALSRAYLTYEADYARFVAGKQRIAWGVMRFWRPTDLFNAESPLQIQQGERIGLDAFRVTAPVTRKGELDVLYSPSRLRRQDMRAGKFMFTMGDYDLTLLGGKIRGSGISGFTYDGYVGNGGFRGEIVRINEPTKKPYYQWTVGGDYTFPNSLTLTLEYLNNGGATGQPINPYLQNSGFLQTTERQLAGFGADYQINPLLRGSTFASYDIDGKSIAIAPRLIWNYKQNLELSAGVQFYKGKTNSEFGSYPSTLFTQVKFYF